MRQKCRVEARGLVGSPAARVEMKDQSRQGAEGRLCERSTFVSQKGLNTVWRNKPKSLPVGWGGSGSVRLGGKANLNTCVQCPEGSLRCRRVRGKLLRPTPGGVLRTENEQPAGKERKEGKEGITGAKGSSRLPLVAHIHLHKMLPLFSLI